MKRKKRTGTWIIVGILICAAFASGYGLSACLQVVPKPAVAGPTIIDDLGRSVTVLSHPQRIVSMAAACTVVLYDIGAENLVVGVDKCSPDYVPESSEKTEVGSCYNPSLETILGLEPDLIFAWYYAKLSTLEESVPIIYIDPKSIDGIFRTMRMIGLVVGRPEKVEQVISGIENRIAAIENKIENLSRENRPLVYYELGRTQGQTVGQGTFTNEMIFRAGGINIAAEEPIRYPILSTEYIIWRNPDVIFARSPYAASAEEIKNRSGWNEINAVKDNRVYEIESSWVSSTPRMILGLEQLAEWFHPTLFGENSLTVFP